MCDKPSWIGEPIEKARLEMLEYWNNGVLDLPWMQGLNATILPHHSVIPIFHHSSQRRQIPVL